MLRLKNVCREVRFGHKQDIEEKSDTGRVSDFHWKIGFS
ncbi:hypothetical protein JTE87_04326 [Bacillus amyloliquefaciens]|nr:hypothetical protein [Bacillus amyloliquefaciens]